MRSAAWRQRRSGRAQAEARLAGADLRDPASWQTAIAALAQDFSPINDQRASAGYRRDVAGALLRKALTEVAAASTRQTRIVGVGELADAAAR